MLFFYSILFDLIPFHFHYLLFQESNRATSCVFDSIIRAKYPFLCENHTLTTSSKQSNHPMIHSTSFKRYSQHSFRNTLPFHFTKSILQTNNPFLYYIMHTNHYKYPLGTDSSTPTSISTKTADKTSPSPSEFPLAHTAYTTCDTTNYSSHAHSILTPDAQYRTQTLLSAHKTHILFITPSLHPHPTIAAD